MSGVEPSCTFVSFVVDDLRLVAVKKREPQRTRRYTKEELAFAFTNSSPPLRIAIRRSTQEQFRVIVHFRTGAFMAATGELIRLINYVDDIVTTLRRISASIPFMEAEERKRVIEHLRVARNSLDGVLAHLEKGGQL
jgi:hypothetical protein